MVLRFRADMSRFQLSFPFRSLRLRTWCIISLPVAPHNSHFSALSLSVKLVRLTSAIEYGSMSQLPLNAVVRRLKLVL